MWSCALACERFLICADCPQLLAWFSASSICVLEAQTPPVSRLVASPLCRYTQFPPVSALLYFCVCKFCNHTLVHVCIPNVYAYICIHIHTYTYMFLRLSKGMKDVSAQLLRGGNILFLRHTSIVPVSARCRYTCSLVLMCI